MLKCCIVTYTKKDGFKILFDEEHSASHSVSYCAEQIKEIKKNWVETHNGVWFDEQSPWNTQDERGFCDESSDGFLALQPYLHREESRYIMAEYLSLYNNMIIREFEDYAEVISYIGSFTAKPIHVTVDRTTGEMDLEYRTKRVHVFKRRKGE